MYHIHSINMPEIVGFSFIGFPKWKGIFDSIVYKIQTSYGFNPHLKLDKKITDQNSESNMYLKAFELLTSFLI